jgi:hypothetical protein
MLPRKALRERELAVNTKMTRGVLRRSLASRKLGGMTNTRRDFLTLSAVAAGTLHAQTAPLDIFQAAAAGDVPRATELIGADPQVVRTRSADGRTPLHFATAGGKPEMVSFLGSKQRAA